MGFLDNSGDIILDAVLTDTGRMRLARGDGSFKIVKFALSDDERLGYFANSCFRSFHEQYIINEVQARFNPQNKSFVSSDPKA